ncbi:MAG: copper amine oxidase N-terminal domain-containing protein [Clostridia bacterium]|nr:copper amine oxidase N-terminal domain-containing protein [Clostridia bacterium]
MKKKLALILVLVMAFVSVGQSVGAINVIMNSSFLEFPDQEPVIENGTTLVPIRPIAEKLGLEILWDDPTDTVTLKKDSFYIELVIGSTVAKTSSGEKALLTAPKIINSRTMVPLRFIAEELGLTVSWNDEYQRVVIAGEVDTFVAPLPPQEEESVPDNAEDTAEPVENTTDEKPVTEEPQEDETTVDENAVFAEISAQSSMIMFEVPVDYLPEDTDDEESFAYRSLDAFDAQHTYNWEKVSDYQCFADGSATTGILYIVQELDPYEGEEYDISNMNQEYPEAPVGPERPQFPDIDWQIMQEELERVLLEQVFIDMGVEIPEDLAELEDEAILELLGLDSEEALSEQLQISMENADLSQVPGYDEYLIWQEENEIYREEQSIYQEEYRAYLEEYAPIAATKNYAVRHFSTLYSQAEAEEWATLFTTVLNTDGEVRYEGVEILEIEGKAIVHATIYAEDPDDEQGVYDYYEYRDGDSLVTIFGGTLFGGEPGEDVIGALSNMTIQ